MSECKRNSSVDDFHVRQAVRHLRRGGVVAHATEGVWGLACDPFDLSAVARVLAIKGRRPDKGLILIGANAGCFAAELQPLPAAQQTAINLTWPGAVSWILPSDRFPAWISGGARVGMTTVAVRVPGHAQARAICAGFGGPLVSTSANPSGRPPTGEVLHVRRWFQNAINYLTPGHTSGRNKPSELRTLGGEVLR